jgi:hypothetical protein
MPIIKGIVASQISGHLFNNTPPVTSGLTHWYDGTDATTMTVSSGNISQWRTKTPSTSGVNMNQSTGSQQPNLETSVRNGRSAVKFTKANNDNLFNSAQPSSGSITHTLCFAGMTVGLAQASGWPQTYLSWGTSNAVGANYGLQLTSNNDALGASRVEAGVAGNQATAGVISANNYSGLWYAQVATISGSSQTQAVNKTDTGTQNATASNVSANSEFFLGWATNPWYERFGFDGYIGDALIYNRVLSAQEKTDMATWLMSKWGIS